MKFITVRGKRDSEMHAYLERYGFVENKENSISYKLATGGTKVGVAYVKRQGQFVSTSLTLLD